MSLNESKEIVSYEQLKEVINNWLYSDDPTHWGDFERKLDELVNGE